MISTKTIHLKTMPENFAQLLEQLASCLPDMQFTDELDVFSTVDSHVKQYLRHYGIDFHEQLPDINFRIGRLDIAGYRIACHYWVPQGEAKGTVLVLHGLFDHVGLYGHLVRHLLEQGYAVAAFDLPGHGLSSGEQAVIDSFDSYRKVLDALVKYLDAVPKPLHAVGQSTGCAILLNALFANSVAGRALDKVVLLAPLVRPRGWRLGKFAYPVARRFLTHIKRHFIKTCSNEPFLEFLENNDPLQSRKLSVIWIGAAKEWLERFPGLPGLERELSIVQGDEDMTVDWRYNVRAIEQKVTGTNIAIIPGAGHHLVNESEALRTKIFAAMPL